MIQKDFVLVSVFLTVVPEDRERSTSSGVEALGNRGRGIRAHDNAQARGIAACFCTRSVRDRPVSSEGPRNKGRGGNGCPLAQATLEF